MKRRRLLISTHEARACFVLILVLSAVIAVMYGIVPGVAMLVSSWFAYVLGYWSEP